MRWCPAKLMYASEAGQDFCRGDTVQPVVRRLNVSSNWRNFSDNLELLRMSGGASTLVMALQNPHSADVVSQALTIICAAVSATGTRNSPTC